MPSATSSAGSALFVKSASERTSREDASHAPGAGAPVHPATPSAHSVTHAAPSYSPEVVGNSVVATSALDSGSGTWLGFETWKRRSNATTSAAGGGGGPKAWPHR